MDPRVGLDDMQRRFLLLLGFELRPFDPPAYSQSLYRLSYLLPKCHAEKETEVVVFQIRVQVTNTWSYTSISQNVFMARFILTL
jgi:hypothetical protein